MYFSERELGPRPRSLEEIGEKAWKGIRSQIERRIEDGSLGYGFPETCPDNGLPVGTDRRMFSDMLEAEIPEIEYPFDRGEVPGTYAALDLLEFCHRHIAQPIQGSYHGFFSHYHLTFDPEPGQQSFRDDINRVLARQGVAFDLLPDGSIRRIAATPTEVELDEMLFATGDPTLDHLLTRARKLYFSPLPDDSVHAVKELWDAWERLKTLTDPSNKKQSILSLISQSGTAPAFLDCIESEARELTRIGNDFQIRHHEIGKAALESIQQVRYFFQRLFAMIQLLLSKGGLET